MRDRTCPVMLFAAGLGTRMAPLTDLRPKPLIEVGGHALLDHALALVRDAGLGPVVANTHYMAGMLQPVLTARRIAISHEPHLLDTGGGLRRALPLLGEGPVVTLNTDSVWSGPNPITRLLAAWDPKRMDAILSLIHLDSAIGHSGLGDFSIDAEGRLTRGRGLVYCGLQVIKTEALEPLKEDVFSLNQVWDALAARMRLFGVVHDGCWCDVGRPESIALAEAMLAEAADV